MGLINGMQKQAPGDMQAAQGQPMPNQSPPQGQPTGQPGDAEETYKRLGKAAMAIVFGKPSSDHLLTILKEGADNPPTAVAQAAMAVLGRMKAEVKGINPDLVFSVAPAVIVFLLQLGNAAKVFEASVPMIKDSLAALAELTKDQPAQGSEMPSAGQMPPEQGMQQQPMGA